MGAIRVRVSKLIWRRVAAGLVVVPLFVSGCFSERSFRVSPREIELLEVALPSAARSLPTRGPHAGAADTNGHAGVGSIAEPMVPNTRRWLELAHSQLAHLLPRARYKPLLTDELIDASGGPVDVFARFHENPATLHTLFGNLSGLEDTAQATGADASDQPPAAWPGFHDVWIPVAPDLKLFGRLGYAERDGQRLDAPAVMVLPGLFGDLHVQRTRDLCTALRENGIHALAIELRGFGQSAVRQPGPDYLFGLRESGDLCAAAAWLQQQPHVRETGLIGFCWGANHALLAAWEASRPERHAAISERIAPRMAPPPRAPVLRAGVIAFSPCLRFEEIIAQCQQRWGLFDNPVLHSLQNTIRRRMHARHGPDDSGSLRRVIEAEFARGGLGVPYVEDTLTYLRWMPYLGKADGDKPLDFRVPVLIVQGANDPLTSAQNVADFMARYDNRNLAALILPGGGHIGFAPYARRYFYGLIVNYFDPQRGASSEGRIANSD